MGLLDGIVGNALGNLTGMGAGGGTKQALMGAVLQLVQQNGGVQGVVDRFRQSGFADHAQSWVGTGQNMALDPAAIAQVFGSGKLAEIASALGASHVDTAAGLAQALPQLIDRLTPDGSIPADHHDLVRQALAMLAPTRPS